jgi:hypothetical protein
MRTSLLLWLWVATCGVVSSVAMVVSTQNLGVTFDEPIYIERGLERWREGTLAPLIRLGTLPLPVDVQTAPLYFWEQWRGERFDALADLPRLLPWARAANLLFWGLLLVYVFRAARHLGGDAAGALAVGLLACEPSFLGHAALATTDLSVTACLIAFAYHTWTGRESAWGWRVGVPALWFGLAALSKASGPVFGCLILLAIEAQRRISGANRTAFIRDGLQIVGLGVLLMFAYCRSDGLPQADALRWAEKLPEGTSRTLALGLVENLRVFPNAADGFFRQVGHNARGHGAYLMGVTAPSALWWYFPVLLTIKLTVPVLALLALSLSGARRHLFNPAMACVVFLLAFSVFCRVQIGIRFMLPLMALLIIALSVAIARAAAESPHWGWQVAGFAALAWSVAIAGSQLGSSLSYVNDLYNGIKNNYEIVSESNFDWGHGLPALHDWAEDHCPGPLAVWYYGTDPALNDRVFEPVRLHEGDIEANFRRIRGRYLAVSTTLVYGPPLSALVVETRRRLQEKEPRQRVGTFLIYEITP